MLSRLWAGRSALRFYHIAPEGGQGGPWWHFRGPGLVLRMKGDFLRLIPGEGSRGRRGKARAVQSLGVMLARGAQPFSQRKAPHTVLPRDGSQMIFRSKILKNRLHSLQKRCVLIVKQNCTEFFEVHWPDTFFPSQGTIPGLFVFSLLDVLHPNFSN